MQIKTVPVREMSDTKAKAEILNYIIKIGRKPYISEVVEESCLDTEQVERILREWGYPWNLKKSD